MVTGKMLEGHRVHPAVSFHVNPGSRQVLENVAQSGGLMAFISSGVRLHEPGCQGCIGMDQAPGTGEVSLRTFPRNFPGRSGTKDDKVYLCSPETAAAAGLKGRITDPRDLAVEMKSPKIEDPAHYIIDERSIVFPSSELMKTPVVRVPNIKPLPELSSLPDTLEAEVVIRVGDNISTDTIMPAGNEILPLRLNIPAISEHVFESISTQIATECLMKGQTIVVGGENYGQGSSREHAALVPRYLGVRAKIVKSFARIHKSNLCNSGILPLTFADPEEYDILRKDTKMVFRDIKTKIERGDWEIPVEVNGRTINTVLDLSIRQRRHLLAGGTLNYVKSEIITRG